MFLEEAVFFWDLHQHTSWSTNVKVFNEVGQKEKLAILFPMCKKQTSTKFQNWYGLSNFQVILSQYQCFSARFRYRGLVSANYVCKFCDYTYTTMFFDTSYMIWWHLYNYDYILLTFRWTDTKWRQEKVQIFLADLQYIREKELPAKTNFFLNSWQKTLKSHLFHEEFHCLMNKSNFSQTQSHSNSFLISIYLTNF